MLVYCFCDNVSFDKYLITPGHRLNMPHRGKALEYIYIHSGVHWKNRRVNWPVRIGLKQENRALVMIL